MTDVVDKDKIKPSSVCIIPWALSGVFGVFILILIAYIVVNKLQHRRQTVNSDARTGKYRDTIAGVLTTVTPVKDNDGQVEYSKQNIHLTSVYSDVSVCYEQIDKVVSQLID